MLKAALAAALTAGFASHPAHASRAFFVTYWHDYAPAAHEVYDEPNWAHVPPAQVRERYQSMKAAQPSATLAVSFESGCKSVPSYIGGFDQMLPDGYYFYYGSNRGLSRWDSMVEYCVKVARTYGLAAPVVVAQAWGDYPDGRYGSWRCPTPDEMAWMVASAEYDGAAGLLWYTIPGHPCPGTFTM